MQPIPNGKYACLFQRIKKFHNETEILDPKQVICIQIS